MSIHNLCFEKKYEKYQNLLSENIPYLFVTFSIYLNRCVFIMKKKTTKKNKKKKKTNKNNSFFYSLEMI